jgi:hypothetical protein
MKFRIRRLIASVVDGNLVKFGFLSWLSHCFGTEATGFKTPGI